MDNTIVVLKSKYLENGFEALTEKEKLMILLSFSVSKNKIEASADKILDIYGSINAASEVDAAFLSKQCDISPRAAVLINLVSYIVSRDDIMHISKGNLDSTDKAKAYFTAHLKNTVKEQVVITATKNNFNIIKTHFISQNEFDKAYVQVRDIIEFAIKNNSKYILISHSHPTATSMPSDSDISTTKSIISQLRNAEIKLVDHIIVSSQDSTSLRELKPEIFDNIERYKTSKKAEKKSVPRKSIGDKEKK